MVPTCYSIKGHVIACLIFRTDLVIVMKQEKLSGVSGYTTRCDWTDFLSIFVRWIMVIINPTVQILESEPPQPKWCVQIIWIVPLLLLFFRLPRSDWFFYFYFLLVSVFVYRTDGCDLRRGPKNNILFCF